MKISKSNFSQMIKTEYFRLNSTHFLAQLGNYNIWTSKTMTKTDKSSLNCIKSLYEEAYP
jgi:hypothetical protein